MVGLDVGRRRGLTGLLVAAVRRVVGAAPAGAQYVAPPPDPGFRYIFDGTTTGSDASFDKWVFSSTTAAASATQGRATVDPAQGAINVGSSPFGGYWYPVRTFGDAVLRLQFTVQNIPTSTRNGGIVVRAPDVRYTGANTAAVLAQKPTGYNYDVCPGATVFCGLLDARGVDDLHVGGRARARSRPRRTRPTRRSPTRAPTAPARASTT